MDVTVHVPGKLFIAGEYAVIETAAPAIVVAINRYLTVTVKRSSQPYSTLFSSQSHQTFRWDRTREHRSNESNPYPLLTTALTIVEQYVQELQPQRALDTYHITITSQLDDSTSGKKYGLGSSGAVTVGIVKALLEYYQLVVPPLVVYKLSVLAQVHFGLNGSFGDIAASSFHGWILYRHFDHQWLQTYQAEHTVYETVMSSWRCLEIKWLNVPSSLHFLVGWTQTPAVTDHYIKKLKRSTYHKSEWYQAFIANSTQCVEQIVRACHTQEPTLFLQAITANRLLLQKFAAMTKIQLETPQLETLCQLAIELGAAAKTSGAGGGDCGICFTQSATTAEQIRQQWQQHHIEPLDLTVAMPN